eukprot:CAMPEP_0206448840 /NCGR_PEP_ID=MMETSP0324_2-20121206/17731_1 /ASSEMBLY_ACC=CAM_ASM_000836 /TAXON_ID=2866 /ORGANISM="Crypthecodinium cohnii, Strain Seligo" /LENGTH=52 /DNA_ID=CAMNT_0053918099 /DNA_START=1 /DNA_END=159 /DNA_ORIENTATION=-
MISLQQQMKDEGRNPTARTTCLRVVAEEGRTLKKEKKKKKKTVLATASWRQA